jgi:hypothetical protein
MRHAISSDDEWSGRLARIGTAVAPDAPSGAFAALARRRRVRDGAILLRPGPGYGPGGHVAARGFRLGMDAGHCKGPGPCPAQPAAPHGGPAWLAGRSGSVGPGRYGGHRKAALAPGGQDGTDRARRPGRGLAVTHGLRSARLPLHRLRTERRQGCRAAGQVRGQGRRDPVGRPRVRFAPRQHSGTDTTGPKLGVS